MKIHVYQEYDNHEIIIQKCYLKKTNAEKQLLIFNENLKNEVIKSLKDKIALNKEYIVQIVLKDKNTGKLATPTSRSAVSETVSYTQFLEITKCEDYKEIIVWLGGIGSIFTKFSDALQFVRVYTSIINDTVYFDDDLNYIISEYRNWHGKYAEYKTSKIQDCCEK